MDKKLVATSIPSDQPEAPSLIMRIAGACLVVGALAILASGFWRTVGPWLVAVGFLTFVVAFVLLIPYWRPAIHPRQRNMHKLYGGGNANQSREQRTGLQRAELDG